MSQSTSSLRLVLFFLALLLVAVGPSVASAQQSLQLDGVNDYVTFGAAPSLGATTFTIEVAFKRTGAGATTSTGTGGVTAVPLLTKGRGEAENSNVDMNWFLGINATNQLVADFEEGAGQVSPGLNHPVVGTTAITNNVWHHAAAVYDGTTWTLYLDGNVEATLVVGAGRLPRFDSIQHAALGSALTSTGVAAGFFAGNLDEARVWNTARTQAQIQAGIGVEIFQAPALVGRWGLNEGAGTGAGNSIAGGANGVLTNGPIWSADSNVALATASGLLLGGANAYAALGSPASLQLSAFTIELWLRRDGAGIGTNTGAGGIPDAIPLVAKGRAEAEAAAVDINYLFGIRASDGVLCADFEEGAGGASPSLNHPVAGVTPITTGVWHHAAATYDGTTWKLYLDGALEASLAVGQPPASASNSPVAIGSALTSVGAAAGFFAGVVDEVRIWNVARTQAQIGASINSEITGASPGLVGRWGMNEDQGTVVASTAGAALNGTLTGAAWAWAVGSPFSAGPPVAPADPTNLAASAVSAAQIDLSWTDNASNETGYEVERSTTGSGGPFVPLFALPANTVSKSDTGLSPGTEYCYRVRAVNGIGTSGYAAASCATTQSIPPPTDPSGLTATAATPVQIDLAWTDNALDETGYEVERSTTGAGGPFTLLVSLPANSVSYSNTALGAATEYCYRVRAMSGTLASGYTAVVCATTLPGPAAPTSLAAVAVTSGQIHLTWTDNATDETGYTVERSTAGSGGPFAVAATLAANAVSFDDLNREAGAEYCYRVRALGAYVPSDYSSVSCATTPTATPGSLDLAGATYVTFGDPNALDLTAFTLECWFRRDGAGTTTTTGTGGIAAAIPLVTHGAPEADNSNVDMNYFMGLRSDGVLCADFEEGAGGPSPGLNHPVVGTTSVGTGSGWHHAAATYDGSTWNLYLDGNLEATLAVGRPVRSNSIQRAALGSALTSTGAANGFFDGAIDEARVWSVARTQAEIRATANAQLGTAQTALAARWSLDEGAGTIVSSSAGTEVPGTITGSNYSWSGPAPFNLFSTYTVTSAVAPAGGGTIMRNPDQPTYTLGASVELTALPSAGYHFVDWAGDLTGAANPQTLTMDANRSVTANFALNTYTITASAGTGGSIDPSGAVTVSHGSDQTFTITPAVGYHIADVLVDGASVGAVGTHTFSAVSAGHTIAASFALDTFTINASAASGGSIDPTGDVTVTYGSDQAFTITPDAGHHISDVLVDGASVGAVAAYTFAGVHANHTIAVAFEVNSFTITASAGPGGSIDPSGAVGVSNGSDRLFTILPGTGYHIADVLVDGVSVGAVPSYTFTAITADHTIAASFALDTFTITASAGPGGSIDPSGDVTVTYGSDQAFTITPAVGYHIADVLVDGASVGVVGTHTFSAVSAGHTIAASFALDTFTIAASAGAGGSIDPSGNVTVTYASDQAFTITPAVGHHIADVLVDGSSIGAVGTHTFSAVAAGHTIAASFALDTFTITASAGPGGTIDPSGDVVVAYGSDRAFTITPAVGYHIADVMVDGSSVGTVGTYTFSAVAAGHTIAASFAIDTFTITASAGANGTISPTGPVTLNYGQDQTFTISASAGHHIADVLVDGTSVGAVPGYTFSAVAGNHTIAASFALDTFTITASAGTGGTIDPSGTVTVGYGADQAFTITPALGYHIADVLVDGASIGAIGTYTFSAVAAGHTIAASFALDTFTIAASAGPGGSIDPSGDVAVGYGTDRTFAITANPGYHVVDVLVDGASVGPVTGYAFTAVLGDHSIAAGFAINTYTITATAGPNGSIAPAGTTTRNYGEDQAYLITPDPGYHVLDLLVDGLSVGALTSYTFTAVSAAHTIAATFQANFDALDFAGTDGYATFGNPAALQLSTFTIEMWMRRDGTGTGTNTGTGGIADLVPLFAKGRAEAEDPLKDINYIFGFRSSTGVLAADFEEAAAPSPNPSLNHPVLGTTPLAIGTWYHVAATYDGSTWRLYRNGALDAELAVGRGVAASSNVAVALGSALNSTNVAAGFFDGRLDEVRVWNTARTATQLASTIDARLTTAVPGLVARWGLDEGLGGTIQSTAGTPLDGALTGVGWNWAAGAPYDVPTYTVTASAGAGGAIDPAGAVPVIPGSTPSFTITPDACHDVADVVVDGSSVGAVFAYTFPPVSASTHTIAASFSLRSYAITASAGANGSVSPAGSTLVGCGDDLAYTITPDLGYHVADVLVDGVSVGALGAYTFSAVAAAHTIAASFAQNGEALALAGTDGYVLFGNPPALKLNAFTIEMWMRRDGTGVGTNTGAGGIPDLVPLLSKGRADTEDPIRDINYILGVSASTGVLSADFEEAAAPSPNPSLNHPVLGTTPLAVGTWYHVAATYDGTTWRLYVNGNLDAQLAVGRGVASASDAPVALGTAMTTAVPAAGFFQGVCDEVRVWSVARAPAEILATINDRITTPMTGLVARWGLDEGAGTLVQSTAGTPLDGTVTGTGWNWSSGAPFNAAPPTAPAAPSNLTAEGVSAGRIDLTWTDGSDNESGFEIESSTSGSGGPFTPLVTVAANTTTYSSTGLAPAAEYCYRIRAVNAAGASTYDGPACSTTEAAPAFALAFNGSTYVNFGDPAALDLPQFTLETWFRRDGAGTIVSTGSGGVTDAIPLVTHGTSQADGSNVDMNFFLGIKSAGAVLCADFEEGAGGATPGLNHPILGVTPIANGVWYHAAATYDGTTWKLYLNGNLESQLMVGRPVQSASIQLAALASSLTSTGTAQGFFVGALDETRIWNAARSQAEIQGTINAQISSSITGLVARWAMDEGSATAVNGSAGTAVNGTISGTAYTWVAGAPFNLAFNLPPSAPALVGPGDQTTGVELSPTLQVHATDPDGQSLTVNYYGRSAVASPGSDFTIVGMPDTQYYTGELNGGTNAILLSQTNWITANRASRNIGYVATLGDCVEHGDNGGNDIEWQHADAGYSLIENPLTTGLPEGLPYGITVGNHDQSPNGNPDGATTVFYNQYFGMNRFTGRSYYGGHYGTNNDNWYNLFSAGGMDFVVISLEYDTTPDAAILTWADGLLTTYANRRAIILSHNLIGTGTPGTFSAQGQATYDALKAHSNLFLMLCGHVPGEGRRSDTFNGNTVYTVMSDYQARANGGSGWLRIMQFSPANNVIHVVTYSPWLDQTENDADSQFDIPYSMSSAESYALLGTVSGVASGGTASLVWPGLLGGTPYQWYATVSDGVATMTGPTWGFTTQIVPTHTLAVTATPASGGTVTRSPNRAAYDEGASVQLTAAPASGWEFRSWCGDASGTASPVTVAMSRDKQVTAVLNEIGAPMVAVSAPNGGEALAIGSLYEIRWTATDAEGVELVDVLLSRSGPLGPFETLGEGIENTGSFLWSVSYPGTANGYVKVVAHNPAALSPSLSGFDLSDASFTIPGMVTGVDEPAVTAFSMRMTSSNPTSAGASIAFALPQSQRVRVELFDAAGRLVSTLADAVYPSGRHALAWTGRTSRGQAPSGVYFVRFRAPGHAITRRFVLVR